MQKELYILLDNVRSTYNVGAIFRTAEAVAVNKIYLAGISGVEKFGNKVSLNPKVAKTALEGINVPWEYTESSIEKLIKLKNSGVQIVSLEQTVSSVDLRNVTYKFPLCLVVGHERDGVNQEITKIADSTIEIPMFGKGKSLNVATATALALYQVKLIQIEQNNLTFENSLQCFL